MARSEQRTAVVERRWIGGSCPNIACLPPLARVGLSEREAEHQGVAARVAKLPASAVLRTQTTDEKQGLMNVLVGEWTTAFSASR
jgi:pyruvate/2-oxoglutarate dehydrogenase complex dihydrolipoamide dehydrogenase (E3) component